MALYREYLEQSDFGSYEDFLKNFKIKVPERFNFAYDVCDRIAEEEPERLALLWVHPDGRERRFTFADIKRESDRCANMLRKLGIGRGDVVMLVLKRHYEFWYTIMALHKLGAVTVPATNQLTKKDIVYRCQAAGVKMIIASAHGDFAKNCDAAMAECPTVENRLLVQGGPREGWLDFQAEMDRTEACFTRPQGDQDARNDDVMLLYFTSGTTGMPKMVAHDFRYPLGHVITGRFWHNLDDQSIHLTTADSGWAKCAWGKFYG